MALPCQGPVSERPLAPWPLLAGVVLGFVGCCLAGRLLAGVNCLGGFTRFHLALNYETLYYPTVSQVRALARETLDPNRIPVILAGNSIHFGYGQGAAGNWVRRLQELLGDDFQVLNLALPSEMAFEFGMTAAEVLLRDHPRVIFVTNTLPGPLAHLGEPDGHPVFRYFYWQAQARGLLADSPEREEALRRLEGERDESFRELRRQCELDARLSFHDLWNAVTYRRASTVWCPRLAPCWTRPRGAYPDLDPVFPPAEERQLEARSGQIVPFLRLNATLGPQFFPPRGKERGWREPASPLPRSVRECLPPCLRGRTLVLLNHHPPYYLRELTAEDRQGYYRAFEATCRVFARAGVRAREVGRNLPQRCYADHIHPTVEGGRRLAEEVAPLIRDLADQLGYPQGHTRQRSAGSEPRMSDHGGKER